MKPNFLFIICHDLGQELGMYGHPTVESPMLDGLAEEGVRFHNYFCASSPCSPSRGCIVTGRYAHNSGLMGLVNRGWDMPSKEKVLADYFNDLGYETYLFGFQHERKDRSAMGYKHLDQGSIYVDAVKDRVVNFLKSEDASAKPFFAMVGTYEVHLPFNRPEYAPRKISPEKVYVHPFLKDTPEVREELSMLHGSVKFTDENVGLILDCLKEQGLEDNTIVIFTTDHGCAIPRAKSSLFDAGIRTATIMKGPGIPKGKTFFELLSNIDMLPTLLELAGGETFPEIQGKSFINTIQGKDHESRQEIFAERNYHDNYDPMRCIRTERWKYIRSFEPKMNIPLPLDIERSPAGQALTSEDLVPRAPEELYDLQNDPNEFNNLAYNMRYKHIRDDLESRLHRWMVETNDPILHGSIPDAEHQ
ncbi:MAG: sulfatase [Candidatus Poribacteria bacterium]